MDYWREKLIEAIDEAAAEYVAMRKADEALLAKVQHHFENGIQPIKDYALRAALENVGLKVEGPVNQVSITQAINKGPLEGTGIEFSNLFDREALKQSLMRIAIRKVAQSIGVADAETVDQLKQSIIAYYAPDVVAQLMAGTGDMVDAAPPAPRIMAMIEAATKKDGYNEPSDFTPAGISNRARQARYRAGKTRHWENR